MKTFMTLAAVTLGCTTLARADIDVAFFEGAPKDRFEITATSSCLTGPSQLTISLTGSAGGLIFDTTAQGAGVEVFQPFELVTGAELVSHLPTVKDGDTALELSLNALKEGQKISFTLDVDDTVGTREITVTGAEIAGASLRLDSITGTVSAIFDTAAHAAMPISRCG